MEYLKFGVRLALSFFITGTAILIFFYFNPVTEVARLAYQFTLVAIVANWIYVFILLVNLLRAKISISNLLKTLGILALNIPIGILYSYFMVWILSYARITFENNTGQKISELLIDGCEKKQINNLEQGDSEEVWIKIPNDCDVRIFYELNGQTKTKSVITALKKDQGLRMTILITD